MGFSIEDALGQAQHVLSIDTINHLHPASSARRDKSSLTHVVAPQKPGSLRMGIRSLDASAGYKPMSRSPRSGGKFHSCTRRVYVRVEYPLLVTQGRDRRFKRPLAIEMGL